MIVSIAYINVCPHEGLSQNGICGREGGMEGEERTRDQLGYIHPILTNCNTTPLPFDTQWGILPVPNSIFVRSSPSNKRVEQQYTLICTPFM